jgi:Flp pilus assembly pilin Flp
MQEIERSTWRGVPQASAVMISRRLALPLRRVWKEEQGIAITEYGLLIALLAILLIGVVSVFSSSIASWFSAKSDKVTSF